MGALRHTVLGCPHAGTHESPCARGCVQRLVLVVGVQLLAGVSRPSKAIWKAFEGAFRRMVRLLRPLPVGSRLISAMYMRFRAAASVGKCPRVRTALRVRALTDSMAFVEQMTVRISTSEERKGVNSAQALCQSLMIAGYFFPQASWNSPERSAAALSSGAVRAGLSALAILSESWRAAQRKLLRGGG